MNDWIAWHSLDGSSCVAVSAAQAEKVRRIGVSDRKVQVIHDAVRPERFSTPRWPIPHAVGTVFPLTTRIDRWQRRELSPEKGFRVFVEAAAEVRGGFETLAL